MVDNTFEVVNEYGDNEIINVIKYFKFKNNDSKYIIYKKNIDNMLYAAELNENEENIYLNPIKEQSILNDIKKYMESINE